VKEPVLYTAPDGDDQAVIQDLRETLTAREGELSMLRASMASTAVIPDSMRTTEPEDQRSWLEQMRANDPERYQEIMERREAARQAARYEIAKKAAHFLFRDDVAMTEEEAGQHMRMMGLLQESLALTERLNADIPAGERQDMVRQLRRNMRDLAPLLESERDKELYRVGKDLGYSDEDAAGFALYIRDVIDLTSVQSIFRSTMRGMGGMGGWGGRDAGERPAP